MNQALEITKVIVEGLVVIVFIICLVGINIKWEKRDNESK